MKEVLVIIKCWESFGSYLTLVELEVGGEYKAVFNAYFQHIFTVLKSRSLVVNNFKLH